MKIIGSDKGIHSPEFHKKKVRERRLKQVLLLLVAVIVIGLPIYLARLDRFRISSIEIGGNEVTKSEDIQRIIATDLSGDYLLVFPKSNALLYPKRKIIRDLLTEEPRLASITITKPSLKSMKVVVSERLPVAEYCSDVSDPGQPENCYFIDETGYIFAPAPAFSGDVYMVYATDAPFDSPIGETVLDEATLGSTLAFVKDLGMLGIYPRVFLVKPDEYHLLLTDGADIMWSKSEKLDDVEAGLASFLEDPSIKKDPSFLSKVAYIDMRFDDKIFYKFLGE